MKIRENIDSNEPKFQSTTRIGKVALLQMVAVPSICSILQLDKSCRTRRTGNRKTCCDSSSIQMVLHTAKVCFKGLGTQGAVNAFRS